MNYNSVVLEKLPNVFNTILSLVDKYSKSKITNTKITIDDSDLSDPSQYVLSESTCSFLVEIEYEIDNTITKSLSFEIPRMINGVFIINGKYKMINQYITDDTVCIMMGDYFRIRYGVSYNYKEGLMNIYDEEEEEHISLSFEEVVKSYPEVLALTPKEAHKLKVILDLDKLPTKLTKTLINKIAKTDINPNDAINKRIIGIDNIVYNSLRSNQLAIAKSLQYNFHTYKSLSEKVFQSEIDKIFYNKAENLQGINTTSNVNPYAFDSANAKVLLEQNPIDRLRAQELDITLFDIIDLLATPDNANVNRINYLNNSIDYDEHGINIKVLDKDFNIVQIPYYEYVASKVVLSDYIDYDEKVITKQEDKFTVSENRKTKLSSTFDYLQLHPDERLSLLSRSVPMVNMSDSIRSSMGTRFDIQALPIALPDRPRVMSGHESDIRDSSTSINFESSIPGKVLAVSKEKVIIEVEGVPKEYDIPNPITGIYDATTVYKSTVNVGDIVKPRDTIITHKNSSSGTKDIGVNTLTAIMPYRGSTYEDAIVISETFAERTMHYSIIDLYLKLSSRDQILTMLPKGSKVTSKDRVITSTSEFRDLESSKLISLISQSEDITKMNNLFIPNNITEAYITDIKCDYNRYRKVVGKAGKVMFNFSEDNILKISELTKKSLPLPPKLDDHYITNLSSLPPYEGFACIIGVRLLVLNKTKVGNKLANRYGSKGVISKVLPDKLMPRTKEGRVVDMIVGDDSIFARKNISQIPEMYLSLVANKIKEIGRGLDLEKFKDLLRKYKLKHYLRLSDKDLEELRTNNINLNFITGSYSSLTIKEILEWMKELNVEEEVNIIDGKTNRPVRNKILLAEMYMMKLYQLPEKANKVFTESSTSEPVLGTGLLRPYGMKHGEMETNALLASDLTDYVNKSRVKYALKDANALSINLLLAGVKLTQ